jgi:hypothetical protein
MRRIFQLCTLGLAAGVVGACAPDQVVKTEDIPTAGVRFINAVPDTGAMDLRFVDIVESNAHFNVAFRNGATTSGGVIASPQIEYKNTRAGQRHFRIFMYGTTAALASTVVKDTTVNIEANKLYTALIWGHSKPGQTPAMRLSWIEEPAPDPGSNVGLRVINATEGPIDVRHFLSTGTAPSAATWGNVPALSISNYVNVAPAQYRFNVRSSGSTTNLFGDALALIGTPATVDIEALPGTTVAGSDVTMIVFPRSVPGTAAPQSTSGVSFAAPAASFMWDRRPPRACSPLC